MAIYNLDGTDKEISVLGRYASVKNNGSGVVYASSTPELDDLEASDIVPVQPGESVVVRDCKKKLYVRGTGEIAVVSGNQPFNFFKSAPVGGGGGGAGEGITAEQLNEALLPYATVEGVEEKLDDKADKTDLSDYISKTGGNVNGILRMSDSNAMVFSPRSSSDADQDRAPYNSTGRVYSDSNGNLILVTRRLNPTDNKWQAVRIVVETFYLRFQYGYFNSDGTFYPQFEGDQLKEFILSQDGLKPSYSGFANIGSANSTFGHGYIDYLHVTEIDIDNAPWATAGIVPNLSYNGSAFSSLTSMSQLAKSGWYTFGQVSKTLLNGDIPDGGLTFPIDTGIPTSSSYNILATVNQTNDGSLYNGSLLVTRPGVNTTLYIGFVKAGKVVEWVNLIDISGKIADTDYVHTSGQLSASLVNTVINPYNYEGFCISSKNIGIPDEYAAGTYYFIKYISQDNIGAIQFAFDMNNRGWFFYRSSNRSSPLQWNPWIKLPSGESTQ